MDEQNQNQEPSPEAKALSEIAIELRELRRQQPSRMDRWSDWMMNFLGDSKEAREAEREIREREQAKLYGWGFRLTAVYSLASVASVVVAVVALVIAAS